MGWKDRPLWLTGGILGLILSLPFFLIIIVLTIFFCDDTGSWGAGCGWGYLFAGVYFAIAVIPSTIALSLAGLIFAKVKNNFVSYSLIGIIFLLTISYLVAFFIWFTPL